MLDNTIVRAHQHSSGAKNHDAEAEAIGRSTGGLGTKIHATVDALGNPTLFFNAWTKFRPSGSRRITSLDRS